MYQKISEFIPAIYAEMAIIQKFWQELFRKKYISLLVIVLVNYQLVAGMIFSFIKGMASSVVKVAIKVQKATPHGYLSYLLLLCNSCLLVVNSPPKSVVTAPLMKERC